MELFLKFYNSHIRYNSIILYTKSQNRYQFFFESTIFTHNATIFGNVRKYKFKCNYFWIFPKIKSFLKISLKTCQNTTIFEISVCTHAYMFFFFNFPKYTSKCNYSWKYPKTLIKMSSQNEIILLKISLSTHSELL